MLLQYTSRFFRRYGDLGYSLRISRDRILAMIICEDGAALNVAG